MAPPFEAFTRFLKHIELFINVNDWIISNALSNNLVFKIRTTNTPKKSKYAQLLKWLIKSYLSASALWTLCWC